MRLVSVKDTGETGDQWMYDGTNNDRCLYHETVEHVTYFVYILGLGTEYYLSENFIIIKNSSLVIYLINFV